MAESESVVGMFFLSSSKSKMTLHALKPGPTIRIFSGEFCVVFLIFEAENRVKLPFTPAALQITYVNNSFVPEQLSCNRNHNNVGIPK